MVLGVKTFEKSGKLPQKEVYNLAYLDGSHKHPITSDMGSVPMHTHLVQSLLCYYREFYIGALSLKSPSVSLGVCSFSVQEGKNLIQCGY